MNKSKINFDYKKANNKKETRMHETLKRNINSITLKLMMALYLIGLCAYMHS